LKDADSCDNTAELNHDILMLALEYPFFTPFLIDKKEPLPLAVAGERRQEEGDCDWKEIRGDIILLLIFCNTLLLKHLD
jgi:hypothetical protein